MEKYKLVLVEDEPLAREGIRNAILRDAPDFIVAGEAENGVRALDLIRAERPDVVVTDISMPRMDGLELIEQIRDERPETAIVIVSGFDDFSYVQRALRFGVRDYLLKPVLPEQIRALLAKVKAEIEKHERVLRGREELENRVKASLPLHRERFFNQLIRGAADESAIGATAAYLGVDLGGDRFGVAILRLSGTEAEHGTAMHRDELYGSAIAELISEVFTSQFAVYALPAADSRFALIICAKGLEERKAFSYCGQYVRRLAASLQRYLALSVHGAIGNLYPDLRSLGSSFSEALEALDFCFAKESGTVLTYADLQGVPRAGGRRPERLEEEFILSVRLCDRRQCELRVSELEAFYRGSGQSDPRVIKMDLLELFIHLFDTMPGEMSALRVSVYEEIQGSGSLPDAFGRVGRCAVLLMDELDSQRDSRLVSRVDTVKELIEAHLGDPDLFLDDVASRVFLSPNYLRTIFKQRTGESFVEYLTRRRMEKASELLKDPTIQVQEIAERVGYANQRYFSACFKKVHGCSPSEFRLLSIRN